MSHPHTFLVLGSITTTISNVHRNGGVVPAKAESRRLAATYPEAELSEAAILAEFTRLAAEQGLLTDVDMAGDNRGVVPRADEAPHP